MHNQDVFLEQTLLEEGQVTQEQLETTRRYAIELTRGSRKTVAGSRSDQLAGVRLR